jgi:cytoskeletal protein CcmA (bactofilin family)
MRTEKIEGIGSILGGEFDRIVIEGVGTIKGDVKANTIDIQGVGKCTGNIETVDLFIEGVLTLTNSIRANRIRIEGVVNQTTSNIEADDIYCDGVLNSNGEISADKIEVGGCIIAHELYGDRIKIIYDRRRHGKLKIPNIFGILGNGKAINDGCQVDIMEATHIELEGVKSNSVSGELVIIGPDCNIKQVECNGTLMVHPSSRIEKIIGVNPSPWKPGEDRRGL